MVGFNFPLLLLIFIVLPILIGGIVLLVFLLNKKNKNNNANTYPNPDTYMQNPYMYQNVPNTNNPPEINTVAPSIDQSEITAPGQ